MGLTGAAPVGEGSGSNFVLGHTELGNSFLYYSYRMIAFDEFLDCEVISFLSYSSEIIMRPIKRKELRFGAPENKIYPSAKVPRNFSDGRSKMYQRSGFIVSPQNRMILGHEVSSGICLGRGYRI